MKTFLEAFKKMGKLERVMWHSSQANKTNAKLFFYALWCTRYGTSGGGVMREATPLSCYECGLRPKCVGFNKIANLKVCVSEQLPKGREVANFTVVANKNGVPKFVYKTRKGLIDEFSGLILHTQKTNNIGKIVTVQDFIGDLPPLDGAAAPQ